MAIFKEKHYDEVLIDKKPDWLILKMVNLSY